jgi:hypothetical protein
MPRARAANAGSENAILETAFHRLEGEFMFSAAMRVAFMRSRPIAKAACCRRRYTRRSVGGLSKH